MKTIYIFMFIMACLISCVTPIRSQSMPLTLAECRRMALANSEDLRMADNAARQAELDIKIANTAMLPKFDASAMGMYMVPDMDMSIAKLQMHGTYLAGINIVQPIYAGGKILAGRKLAKIGKEVSSINQRKTKIEILAETDKAYWTLLAVADKVKLLEFYSAMIDTIYQQTHAAVKAGMAIENDLLRIDTRRSDITYQLQKARNGKELCRLSLCHIIGVDFSSIIELTDSASINKAPENLDTDISARPELELLEAGIKAKEQQVKLTRGDYLPTVGLSLGYSYYGNMKLKGGMQGPDGSYIPFSNSINDGYGIALLSVSIPLFHWGEGSKKIKRAKIELENSRLDMEKNTRLMSIQAIQASKNVEDGFRMIASARLALTQATENLRVMRNRYEARIAPLTDLLEAQTQWQQASSDCIEAQTQYKIYESQYLASTGRLE